MSDKKFVTALNCMDGRVQYPVLKWLMENLGADYVDMITEPGVDKIFCECREELLQSVKQKISISIEKHNSNTIAIVGHHDCAGNCVCKEDHYKQVEISVSEILKCYPTVRVLGLFVNKDWAVEVIRDTALLSVS
ncbi:MAG: hypothetical protein JJT76_17355 [Clostridiaceae bacterium]|nr:hypothetical protein [Clostridiaceae bacterium]